MKVDVISAKTVDGPSVNKQYEINVGGFNYG